MYKIEKSIEQGFSGRPGGLFDILTQLQNGMFGMAGETYFVEGNVGSDASDGKSWDGAFKTLATAITASNASIAHANKKGYAVRNAIFVRADSITEDLTVPPSKCDVIGVGSTDAHNMTEIKGEHSWTGSGTIMNTGWYNLCFVNDDASAIFTVATPAGLYYDGCLFRAEADAIHAIHLTGATGHDFTVNNCRFINDEYNDRFATGAILNAVTTTYHNFAITNSYLEGEYGIKIDTTNLYNAWINNCTVVATGVTIDDNSDDCIVTNNTLISEGDITTQSNCYDFLPAKAANNVLTGDDATVTIPTLSDLITYSAG